MAEFKIHDVTSAPQDARPLLEKSLKAYGMIPNLHGVMAESPQTLEAYQALSGLFEATSLTVEERNVVWLTLNVRHDCHYCVPAHTAIAKGQGVSDAVIDALRDETTLPDAKLEALRAFTLAVVDKRGDVSESDLNSFFAAGYTNRQVLDVVTGVAHKVMSNYINHFADTPIDKPFQAFAWEPKAATDAA